MARATRSSKRKSEAAQPAEEPAKVEPEPEPTPVTEDRTEEDQEKEQEEQAAKDDEGSRSRSSSPDLCPGCTNTKSKSKARTSQQKDRTWVMCESCETWYHWDCVGGTGELEAVDKW